MGAVLDVSIVLAGHQDRDTFLLAACMSLGYNYDPSHEYFDGPKPYMLDEDTQFHVERVGGSLSGQWCKEVKLHHTESPLDLARIDWFCIAASSHAQSLSLNLSGSTVNGQGLMIIARTCHTLRRLDLAAIEEQDQGQMLAPLIDFQSPLVYLNLTSWFFLRDEHAIRVCEHLPNLGVLVVSHCHEPTNLLVARARQARVNI